MSKNDNHFNSLEIYMRPFTDQDADLVFAFFNQLSEHTRTMFNPHPFTEESALQLTVGDVANEQTRRFMVCVREGQHEVMIGYFFFWDWHTSIPWFGIAVADPYQEKGLGRKIMAYAIESAQSHGKGGILLTTNKINVRGQALYHRSGFVVIGESPNGELLMVHRY